MYVLPFEALLQNLGMTREEFLNSKRVMVPTSLLRFLTQIALANSDFNEQGYLAANPDVEAATRKGAIANSRLHYIGDGYFEARDGATPDVDEAWYLKTYPDVAAAVGAGRIGSATEHFKTVGAREGRSPNVRYVQDTEQWMRALRGA